MLWQRADRSGALSVTGLHTQFGSDAATEVVVSWHTAAAVEKPHVLVGTPDDGVGSAVAIGRLGAMSGPLVAGKMLALGTGTAGVMMASAPGIVMAALAVFYLSVRRNRSPAD